MRRHLAGWLLAAALAVPAAAQQSERPLDGLLESLPPPEGAPQGETDTPPKAPENGPAIPIVRPPPFSAMPAPLPPPPTVTPGHVGTLELPPSSVTYGMPLPAAEAEPAATPIVAVEAPPAPVGADVAANANWAALQEQRRQEINMVESPIVARLNANVAAEQEAARQRAEQAQAEYEQALVEREESIRRAEAEHQAAIAAHDAEVARERAAYEARVAACLDGDREACAPR